jgi:hypothetical protein
VLLFVVCLCVFFLFEDQGGDRKITRKQGKEKIQAEVMWDGA